MSRQTLLADAKRVLARFHAIKPTPAEIAALKECRKAVTAIIARAKAEAARAKRDPAKRARGVDFVLAFDDGTQSRSFKTEPGAVGMAKRISKRYPSESVTVHERRAGNVIQIGRAHGGDYFWQDRRSHAKVRR